ncbi:hypothetical protein FQR65_LT14716 [Abscondita terminalis]|nr:hypothetical protein FQR65_LT14716 [Abscondita terminalis]
MSETTYGTKFQRMYKKVVIEDCKKRWKRLKDVYWKKKKESKQSTGSSTRSINKWEHIDALGFLKTIERFRKTSNNVNVDIDENIFPESPDESEDLNDQELQEIQKEDIQELQEDTLEMLENISEEAHFTTKLNLKRSTETLKTNFEIKKRKTTAEKILVLYQKEEKIVLN